MRHALFTLAIVAFVLGISHASPMRKRVRGVEEPIVKTEHDGVLLQMSTDVCKCEMLFPPHLYGTERKIPNVEGTQALLETESTVGSTTTSQTESQNERACRKKGQQHRAPPLSPMQKHCLARCGDPKYRKPLCIPMPKETCPLPGQRIENRSYREYLHTCTPAQPFPPGQMPPPACHRAHLPVITRPQYRTLDDKSRRTRRRHTQTDVNFDYRNYYDKYENRYRDYEDMAQYGIHNHVWSVSINLEKWMRVGHVAKSFSCETDSLIIANSLGHVSGNGRAESLLHVSHFVDNLHFNPSGEYWGEYTIAQWVTRNTWFPFHLTQMIVTGPGKHIVELKAIVTEEGFFDMNGIAMQFVVIPLSPYAPRKLPVIGGPNFAYAKCRKAQQANGILLERPARCPPTMGIERSLHTHHDMDNPPELDNIGGQFYPSGTRAPAGAAPNYAKQDDGAEQGNKAAPVDNAASQAPAASAASAGPDFSKAEPESKAAPSEPDFAKAEAGARAQPEESFSSGGAAAAQAREDKYAKYEAPPSELVDSGVHENLRSETTDGPDQSALKDYEAEKAVMQGKMGSDEADGNDGGEGN